MQLATFTLYILLRDIFFCLTRWYRFDAERARSETWIKLFGRWGLDEEEEEEGESLTKKSFSANSLLLLMVLWRLQDDLQFATCSASRYGP